MIVCIAGSRGITDPAVVDRAMSTLSFEPLEIVSGGAKGVDMLGLYWASKRNIPVKKFIPDWLKLGKSAGIVRNTEMAEYLKSQCGILVAIWDGESRGTKHMIDYCRQLGIPVYLF